MNDVAEIRALINTCRDALAQGEGEPDTVRVPIRTLLAQAVPMLERFALAEERAAQDRRMSYARHQWRARQGAKRKYGFS